MKKLITLFFIFLLTFNLFTTFPSAQVTNIKEGLYKASDLNLSTNNTYSIQNLSPKGSAYVLIFNEDNVVQQSLRLEPGSSKYNLSPLQPDYRIVIVGNGDISIS